MDLREFLLRLGKVNQLKVLQEELDWNLQVGAISAMNNRLSGPAIHFKKIKDYAQGYSLVSGLYAGTSNLEERKEKPWTRQAVAQGLDPAIGYEDFISEMLGRTAQTIPPLLISTGACKEKILSAQDIDILRFPVPYIHQGDGGRYSNGSVIIAKDPETGSHYWGWHRCMVVDPQRIAIDFRSPITPWSTPETSHLGVIYKKYQKQQRATPAAIIIGGSPTILMASAMFNPLSIDVAGVAGGLMKEPIPLVKTETADLYVPAQAEIVIEGEISPQEMVEEGPYPDIVRRSPITKTPVFKIKKITHRNEPILPFMADADRGSEAICIISSLVSLHLTQACKAQGIGVRWVNCPVEAFMSVCFISIERIFPGHPSAAARTLFMSPLGKWFDKIMVMDPDIEPVDLPIILTCLAEKADPERYHFIKGSPSYLVSYSNSEEKNNPIATKLYIDATYPLWWEPSWLAEKLSIESCFPDELKHRTTARWKEMGLPGEPYLKKVRTLKTEQARTQEWI